MLIILQLQVLCWRQMQIWETYVNVWCIPLPCKIKSVQSWMWVQADIVKQIWKELPKHMDTPVAPLDEEMLVDLAKEPAVIEGHLTAWTWG